MAPTHTAMAAARRAATTNGCFLLNDLFIFILQVQEYDNPMAFTLRLSNIPATARHAPEATCAGVLTF
jgi:hypothetical protein